MPVKVTTITGTPGNDSNNYNISQPNIPTLYVQYGSLEIRFNATVLAILRFFVLGVLPKIFSMTRPNHSNLGFTLIEMLTVVLITGILAAIGVQSLAKNNSFSNTVVKVTSGLRVTSLKARANAGIPHRVTLEVDPNTTEQFLRTQYLVNDPNYLSRDNCNASPTAKWRQDATQDIYIPKRIVIPNTIDAGNPSIKPFPGFCFDGRGKVTSLNGATRIFSMKDSKPGEKATLANISISAIGDFTYETYSSNSTPLGTKFN